MCITLHELKRSMAIAFACLVPVAASAQTQITDEAGLKAIANDLSGNYVLANDITLNGEWTAIGSESAPFTGTLNGSGHAIKGLVITTGADNMGLFGYTKGATLKNLLVTGASVKGNHQAGILAGVAYATTIEGVMTSGIVTGYDHIGGIVGDAKGNADNGDFTYITNCMSTAGVYSTGYQTGIIAGWTNAGFIQYNFVMGTSFATNSWAGAAGIVGLLDGGSATLSNNVSAAYRIAIDVANNNDHIHGILGWNNNGSITLLDNLTSANTIFEKGGTIVDHTTLAGDFQGTETPVADLQTAATYTNLGFGPAWSLADNRYPVLAGMGVPFDGDAIKVDDVPEVAVVGLTYSSNAVSALGKTVTLQSSAPSIATVNGTDVTFNGAGTATIIYSTPDDGYTNGAMLSQTFTITETNYNISTAQDLQNIKNNPAGDYKLVADIDLSGIAWEPIPGFSGTLDGQGHIIKNLRYNSESTDKVGLFSYTEGATIQDLGIVGANIVGNANTAAIAGQAKGGLIQRCFVIESYIEGRDHVGSFVGDMAVLEGNGVVITNCLANATIKSRQYQAGGMVGVSNGGTLQNCYFSGTVDHSVSCGASMVSLLDSDTYPTTIQNCLSAASHLYSPSPKRVINTVGRSLTMLNNYGIKSTNISARGTYFTGTSDPDGDNGATIDDAVAKTKKFYASTLGWDFENTWTFISGTEGKMYPVLKWMTTPLPTTIFDLPVDESVLYNDGSEYEDLTPIHGSWGQELTFTITENANLVDYVADEKKIYVGNSEGVYQGAGNITVKITNGNDIAPFLNMQGTDTFTFYVGQSGAITKIFTPEDFINISKNLQGSYELGNDIDMSGVYFKGIATSTVPFSGTLDGQGFKVKNLSMNITEGENVGVFGQTASATIKNIAFEDLLISAPKQNHVGLIGSAVNTTIEQVAITGKVVGYDHVAMLAGDGDGLAVTNSYVFGIVSAYSQAGGYAGCTLTGGATFKNCYSNAYVECTTRGWAGGFIGLVDKSNSTIRIDNCVSIGNCKSSGDGSPHVAAPFIAGNGAGSANAIIFFNENNIYNSQATMEAENLDQAWPAKNETADGGTVYPATGQNTTVLQNKATYTNIGWDFDNIWDFDISNGYLYPVLKVMRTPIANGIKQLFSIDGTIAVSAEDGKLNLGGLDGNAKISIYTAAGQRVASANAAASGTVVNLPAKGIYIVTVQDNGTKKSFKIVNK